MACQRKFILRLAGDLPLLRDFFGGDAHAVGDGRCSRRAGRSPGPATSCCPSSGTMLMLSVPPAIITSASPRRMRSAASATACSPDEQKRLIVMPGTLSGSPASSTRCARRSCPARPRASRSRRSRRRWLPDRVPAHCASALSTRAPACRRADGVEHAARRLADRRADGGDDVGFLILLSFQRILDSNEQCLALRLSS